ncbi:MAG: hypothetical protein M0Z94_11330 [Dehalococcoidales bacterium]|nr:hypothetical protein [Dehalococcoidales bacterium]
MAAAMGSAGSSDLQMNAIRFRLITSNRWIVGQTATIHRRLIDLLNSENTESLAAQDVGILQQGLPPQPVDEGADWASVNTSAVILAIPQEETINPTVPRDPHMWVKKQPARAKVGVGPYELTGNVHVPDGCELDRGFLEVRVKFIAMTTVSIRRVDDPTFLEEQSVVIVNKAHIDYVMRSVAAPTFKFEEEWSYVYST